MSGLVRDRPELAPYLLRCRDCGIRFFSHPCNDGRVDIACPFGCRSHHLQQESSRRSREYYQSTEGRDKKRALNARRPKRSKVAIHTPADDIAPEIISYLQLILGLIERRRVARLEVLELLRQVMSQRSLVCRRNLVQCESPESLRPP